MLVFVFKFDLFKFSAAILRRVYSNNSLTPGTSFEKRYNLDELINIPTKAEERSITQILLRTQDPNIRQAQYGIRIKNHS